MWMPVEAKGCDYMWNKHYYICFCVCVSVHMLSYALGHIWKSEDNL